MSEVEGERGLPIAAATRVDAGGGAAQRAPAIGADGQASRQHGAIAADRHPAALDLDRVGFTLDARERGNPGRAGFQRGGEKPVLDVVPERVEPDLARGKRDLRRPQQPRGIVDDPHDAQRRGMLSAPRPDAERVERLDRAVEQRGSAVVRRSSALGDQRGFDPR